MCTNRYFSTYKYAFIDNKVQYNYSYANPIKMCTWIASSLGQGQVFFSMFVYSSITKPGYA